MELKAFLPPSRYKSVPLHDCSWCILGFS